MQPALKKARVDSDKAEAGPSKPGPTSTPVTCVTGFLGAGKTTTILGLLKQLPKDYKVVLLKNEFGDVRGESSLLTIFEECNSDHFAVDSLLSTQPRVVASKEILNGCICCTNVGMIEDALVQIRDDFHPDRIIVESSGSAFPATLALQIRTLEPKGFKLDGVVTVIDCENFRGYEDQSPSAKLQAKYTDMLLLSKHQLVSERDMDILMDHLGTLNDTTPRIKVSHEQPVLPSVVFGLDTKLFMKEGEEQVDWGKIGGDSGWHGDEVETKTIWKGGSKPGESSTNGHDHLHQHENGEVCHHNHEQGTAVSHDENGDLEKVEPLSKEELEECLEKLSFEIYRVKGIVRLKTTAIDGEEGQKWDWTTYILNYAFGRHELTHFPSLDYDEDLQGVSLRLTMMGERGEVAMRARKFAALLGAQVA